MLTTYGICTLADTNKVCRSIPSKTNTAINLCDTTKIYNLPIFGYLFLTRFVYILVVYPSLTL